MKPTEKVEALIKAFSPDQPEVVEYLRSMSAELERVQNLYSESCRLGEEAMRIVRQENADLKRRVDEWEKAHTRRTTELKAELSERTVLLNQTISERDQLRAQIGELNNECRNHVEQFQKLRAQIAESASNQDPYHYFKVHEVGRPLPIDTEILLDDGRWVEACSWPQYDATINYQARVKKPFVISALSAVK